MTVNLGDVFDARRFIREAIAQIEHANERILADLNTALELLEVEA